MTRADLPSLPAIPDYCVASRPNNSLDARQRWALWLVVAIDARGIVPLGGEAVAFGETLPAVERIAVARSLRRLASTH